MKKGLWYITLFLLMVVWGLNVVAIKLLVEYFPPVTMQAIRVFTAGIVLLLVLIISKKIRRLTKKEMFNTAIAGLFGVMGHHYFIGIGLSKTTAANGGLILALVPLVTSILAIIFLKDKMTLLRFSGIFIGLVGVSFIVMKGNNSIQDISIGDLYMFGAVVTQAISFIIIKKTTTSLDSRLMTSIMMIFGSTLLFFISQGLEPHSVKEVIQVNNIYIWILFILSAIIATGLGHLLYNMAMQQLGAGQTAIFINLTPFFSLLGSAIFLKEVIHSSQILGFVLIIIGVLLGTGTIGNYLRRIKKNRLLIKQEVTKQNI